MRARALSGRVFLVVCAMSCGDSGDGGGGGTGQACVPGQQESCGCPGGSIGAQVCEQDGSGFEPCICDAGTGSASSNGSTTTMTASESTSDGSTGGGSISSGGSSGGSGSSGMMDDTPDCYDDAAAVDGGWRQAATEQGVCTVDQITSYFDGCLGDMADLGVCGAFEMDAANEDCIDCMYGANTATVGPLFLVPVGDGLSLRPNRIGCEALAQGLPECAAPVSEMMYCALTACSMCEGADAQACLSYALDDPDSICTRLFVVPMNCEALFMPTEESPECAGATFGAYYDVAVPFICGPPL